MDEPLAEEKYRVGHFLIERANPRESPVQRYVLFNPATFRTGRTYHVFEDARKAVARKTVEIYRKGKKEWPKVRCPACDTVSCAEEPSCPECAADLPDPVIRGVTLPRTFHPALRKTP